MKINSTSSPVNSFKEGGGSPRAQDDRNREVFLARNDQDHVHQQRNSQLDDLRRFAMSRGMKF